MNDFWAGFEKRAEEQPTEDGLLMRFGKGMGATTATAGLTTAGALGLGALDKKLTPQEQEKLIQHMTAKYRMARPDIVPHAKFDLQSMYFPQAHTIISSQNPGTGVLAHELGHATSSAGGAARKALISRAYPVSKLLHGMPAFALLSGNEKIRDMAAPASLAMSAPMLAEEGLASVRALRSIARTHGKMRALRAAPALAGAFASYAATPAGIYLANKWIKRRHPQNIVGAQEGGRVNA